MQVTVHTVAVVLTVILVGAVTGCASTRSGPTPPPPHRESSVDPADPSTELYQDVMWEALMAHYPDARRPKVQVRAVIDDRQFAAVFTPCMRDAGFSVTVAADTSFEVDEQPADDRTFSLAMYGCEARYPRPFILSRMLTPTPYDEAAAARLYTYYAETLLPCLAAADHSLPAAPAWASFLSSINQEARYLPYRVLVDASPEGIDGDAWRTLTAECPPSPVSAPSSPTASAR